MSHSAVQRMESTGAVRLSTANKIQAAFEAAGVRFDNTGAPGIRRNVKAG